MMITVLVVFILALPAAMIVVGISISGPKYRGPVTDHFDGSRFINPGRVKPKGMWDVIKWMINRKRGPWPQIEHGYLGNRPVKHYNDGIRVTFINHSTFLIQVDGVNILTDPVWSTRVSPFSWLGPKRAKPPGVKFEDLPRIHVVALSHNHYDHLDLQTMRMIFGGHHPRIITPLGVRSFLERESISGITEGDWWDEHILDNDVTIQLVPAQHFSGRGFSDRDATLWCGYVIKTSKGSIYFAGDTGYNEPMFREIRSRSGPFKVSMLPVGAYKPDWFMSPIHTSPRESLKIHHHVGSETSIGMHFGTFPLADDGYDDPHNDLKAAMAEFQIRPEDFLMLREGEAMTFE